MFTHRVPRFATLTVVLLIALVVLAGAANSPGYGITLAQAQDPPPLMPPDDPGPEDVGDDQPTLSQPTHRAPLAVSGGVWLPQGTAPAFNGQVEGWTMQGEVSGAIHAVAAHPTNADILYAGAANGGIWKTSNATAAVPTWVAQTDFEDSLSIGALEFDPTDANTLVAGIGRYSAFAQAGGPLSGLLRTTDGGTTWTALPALTGKKISGVAPRGSTIVASAWSGACGNCGLFHSTDTGASFTQKLQGDAFDLASDSLNPAMLYSGITYVNACGGGSNGIYKYIDTGVPGDTWAKVSNAVMDALIIDGTTNNIEIDARGGHVFANIIQSGQSVGIFDSSEKSLRR